MELVTRTAGLTDPARVLSGGLPQEGDLRGKLRLCCLGASRLTGLVSGRLEPEGCRPISPGAIEPVLPPNPKASAPASVAILRISRLEISRASFISSSSQLCKPKRIALGSVPRKFLTPACRARRTAVVRFFASAAAFSSEASGTPRSRPWRCRYSDSESVGHRAMFASAMSSASCSVSSVPCSTVSTQACTACRIPRSVWA